jgi:hypothetical protein
MKLSLANTKTRLDPGKVISMLFYFEQQSHHNHLQMESRDRSYSRHKAMNKLYKRVQVFKDDISELVLGYIAPVTATYTSIPVNTSLSDMQVADNLAKFADELYEYAESVKWWALSNKAAELSELAVRTKYLLTLQ